MKVISKNWFTEMGVTSTIGIVLLELEPIEMQGFDTKNNKIAFIGTVEHGNTEKQDVDKIIRRGARFPVAAAEMLLKP